MFKEVHKYLMEMTPERPPVLREMEAYASAQGFPIIGPLVGRLLYQLALVTGAGKIFEMGSGFGYSAYWFSLACRSRGEIIMTDGDKNNKHRALDYFKQASLQSRFDFHVGDARRILMNTDGPFDIILNDIDKEQYPETIDIVAPKLRKGGLFITDNLIWSGKVCQEKPDQTTGAIIEFTRRLYRDKRFFTTIMPVRDGISLSVRL